MEFDTLTSVLTLMYSRRDDEISTENVASRQPSKNQNYVQFGLTESGQSNNVRKRQVVRNIELRLTELEMSAHANEIETKHECDPALSATSVLLQAIHVCKIAVC